MFCLKLRLDCVVCIAKQALKAARLATDDVRKHEEVLRLTLDRLKSISWDGTPPQLVRRTGVVAIIRDVIGVSDPYKELKRKSNAEALELVPWVESLIRSSEDPLRTAFLISIAGNIIDFAAVEEYDLEATVTKVLATKPAKDDYISLRNDVREAETLLYFADNAGEIVFDKVLIQEMIRFRERPFKRVVFVVKGGPIINDATLEDVHEVGLDSIPNIEFRTISSGAPGTGPERLSEEVLSWIRSADIVISKGQGNYEDLSEVGGVYFLLMAKCPVVAEDIGVNVGDVVIMRS